MQTMHPCITLGSYVWAQDRLPVDEFRLRLEDIHAVMDARGWKALLVYGDAREHAALAYVSNFIPRMRWGMALLPREGEARLLCSMSSRDIPAMRTMTWIGDVQSGWEWSKAFDPWLERFKDAPTELGTVGFDLMAPVLQASLTRSIGDRFRLHRADEALAIPGIGKRPREISMMRAACSALDTAARAFVDGWQQSGAPETAALQAERVARRLAAQDVRTLVSLNGGRTLVPFQGRFERTDGPLVAYLAVKQAGYWADAFVTAGADGAAKRADAALDAVLAAARPGVTGAALHAAATRALGTLPLHPALSGSVGHAIGLSLHEGGEFHAAQSETLQEGGVYALQAGFADAQQGHALTSAIVQVGAAGAVLLSRRPGPVSP
jgi:Xaa-Pro aminopeptidase